MKKILLVLFLTPLFLFSKEDTLTVKDKCLSVGVSYSPDFCYTTVSNNRDKGIYVPKIGYSYGFTIKYRICKNVSIKMGFAYHKMGYQTKKGDSIFYQQYQSGVFYKSIDNLKAVYSYTFYGVPILIDFKIRTKNKKLFLNVSCGAEINWLPNAQFKIINDKNITTYSYTYIKGNGDPLPNGSGWMYPVGPRIMGLLNTGFNYKLNNKFTLSLEPSFRFSFNQAPSGVEGYIYSIGINTGINYTF